MARELEELRDELIALPDMSREWLAGESIDSLNESRKDEIEKMWLEEVRHRAAEIDEGSVVCISAAEALERIRTRLRCLSSLSSLGTGGSSRRRRGNPVAAGEVHNVT